MTTQENLETRTIHDEFLAKGFYVLDAVPDTELLHRSADILIDYAAKRYSDLRILSAEIALEGGNWQLETPSHLFYVIDNKKHPSYKLGKVNIVIVPCRSVRSGQVKMIQL